MPKTELTSAARQALVTLLLYAEKATNPGLKERFGVGIDTEPRNDLKKAQLITVNDKKKPYVHELTDEGRIAARAELAKPAPEGAGTGVKLLYAMANVLNRVIAQQGLDVDKVFAVEGDPLPPQRSLEPTQEHVLAAYHALSRRRADLVSLVKLRNRLSDVDRADLDKLLKTMDRQRVIQLEPDPNQKALPREARDAAISIGGEDKHFITIGHR